MQVIKVGPDEVDDYDIKQLKGAMPATLNLDVIIYWYEQHIYSGSGVVVYRDSNGDWHKDSIEHCSCFAPFDNAWNPLTYTKKELITILEDNEAGNAIKKALEKLNGV